MLPAVAVLLALILTYYVYRRWLSTGAPALAGRTAEFKTQTLDLGDLHIRFHRSGRGPHLLLIHGIGANLYCWRLIAPLLTRHFTITALDLPGFGQSAMPSNATYGLDPQIERLRRFLDALKIRQTYVVGNSMGGNLALWLTLKHPEYITKCAVIAPATSRKLIALPLDRLAILAKPAALLLTRQIMGWAHRRTVSKKTLIDLERIEETFKTYGGQNEAVRSFLLASEAIRDRRLPTNLKNINTKVLILYGSKDLLVPRKVIDELEQTLPQTETHVHLGGGHHLQEDEPEWTAEKLKAFFQSEP